jgi:hypothetical protein
MATIRILGMRAPCNIPNALVINVCSNSPESFGRLFSPFLLGPCALYGGLASANFENAWQFAKVYKQHTGSDGSPNTEYWEWARAGWADPTAHRYPMGRGARPEYSLWDGDRLGYIDARKIIYAPLYAQAVEQNGGLAQLRKMADATQQVIVLRDFDGYDYTNLGVTLTEVLNNPRRKMGHAFVLAMLLADDPALKQCAMRCRWPSTS